MTIIRSEMRRIGKKQGREKKN